MKIRIFSVLCLLCILLICGGCRTQEKTAVQPTEHENRYFEITDKSTANAQKYEYVIYTKAGKEVCREEVDRQPHIALLTNGLLEIMTSHGSSAQLYRYYDTEKDVFSGERFWNRALICEDGKIVYMSLDKENKTVLIIQDIFDKTKYYKEVYRDFSPLAVPGMVLKEAKISADGNLEITYYSGENQKLKSETVSLK